MNYFEVKVKYEKVQEDGKEKKVTESYLVDALSFTECEKRIIEEMKLFVSGEFEVYSIAKTKYEEIIYASIGSKILGNETDKLLKACKNGNGQQQLDQPTDFNYKDIETGWYKTKLVFTSMDDNGKEKQEIHYMLVEGTNIDNAKDNLDEFMKTTMADFKVVTISETPIMDIYKYQNNSQNTI